MEKAFRYTLAQIWTYEAEEIYGQASAQGMSMLCSEAWYRKSYVLSMNLAK